MLNSYFVSYTVILEKVKKYSITIIIVLSEILFPPIGHEINAFEQIQTLCEKSDTCRVLILYNTVKIVIISKVFSIGNSDSSYWNGFSGTDGVKISILYDTKKNESKLTKNKYIINFGFTWIYLI